VATKYERGTRGTAFSTKGRDDFRLTTTRVDSIDVRTGLFLVDAVQLTLDPGSGTGLSKERLSYVGGTGGSLKTVVVPFQDTVNSVTVWPDRDLFGNNNIAAVQFHYTNGQQSDKFGGSGGVARTLKFLGTRTSLFGMYGRAGSSGVYELGFYYLYECGTGGQYSTQCPAT
jgi:hypothetical protein